MISTSPPTHTHTNRLSSVFNNASSTFHGTNYGDNDILLGVILNDCSPPKMVNSFVLSLTIKQSSKLPVTTFSPRPWIPCQVQVIRHSLEITSSLSDLVRVLQIWCINSKVPSLLHSRLSLWVRLSTASAVILIYSTFMLAWGLTPPFILQQSTIARILASICTLILHALSDCCLTYTRDSLTDVTK